MRRALSSGIFSLVLVAVALQLPPATHPTWLLTAVRCDTQPIQPDPAPSDVPWAQQRFDYDRIATFADGAGIRVAVIDSGVDAHQPQLKGAVLAGQDLLDAGGNGETDCIGHGTAVASLIAARPTANSPLRGLAPGAEILPFRVTERTEDSSGNDQGRTTGTAGVATAIRRAVVLGAKVINLSLAGGPDPRLESAIRDAADHDVVIVAAVGNQDLKGDPTPYPADYDNVLGVGSVDQTGQRVSSSQVGPYVDVAAPGAAVTVAALPTGTTVQNGTSFAAPFVAATAALIRQYRPGLTAPEVIRRIVETADPAPSDPDSHEYGAGIVNPYRALTDDVDPNPRPTGASPHPSRAAAAARAGAGYTTAALVTATAAVALTAVLLITAAIWRRGRRRHWRPEATRLPGPPDPEVEEAIPPSLTAPADPLIRRRPL